MLDGAIHLRFAARNDPCFSLAEVHWFSRWPLAEPGESALGEQVGINFYKKYSPCFFASDSLRSWRLCLFRRTIWPLRFTRL